MINNICTNGGAAHEKIPFIYLAFLTVTHLLLSYVRRYVILFSEGVILCRGKSNLYMEYVSTAAMIVHTRIQAWRWSKRNAVILLYFTQSAL